jgi:hypothetical protein
MTKVNKHKALILQWADGAEIQRYQPVDDRWIDCGHPTWRPEYAYRVKPVPRPDIFVGVQAYAHVVRLTPLGECSNLQLVFDGTTHELKSAIVR